MKIISRYVLREHAGPLTFALTALTSLLLLNFISRQLGELVGKGLPWSVIGEFLLLSVPFTIALTVPMSVLVSVLYAFSRLAAENEVTALKANGVSPFRLVAPALGLGLVASLGLLAFNDQVLPRANHRLKTLQEDISQTKPTLALKDQVINPIAEGKFYIRAGRIDRESGRMRDVVIYNLVDPARRRTIYAQSGRLAFAANRVDLDMELFQGQMIEVSTDKPGRLDRIFFKQDRIRVAGVARSFRKSATDSLSKGDREMGVCEMQQRLWQADGLYRSAKKEYEQVVKSPKEAGSQMLVPLANSPEPRGLGWAYCRLLRAVGAVASVKEARAEEPGLPQDTTKKVADTTTKSAGDTAVKTVPAPVVVPAPSPATPVGGVVPVQPGVIPGQAGAAPGQPAVIPGQPVPTPLPNADSAAMAQAQALAAAQAAAAMMQAQKGGIVAPAPAAPAIYMARTAEARLRLEQVTRSRNRYELEIHKKFSLAAACLIFVIVAAPIAVRFPRGGVGLVIGVSLVVFALYYVGLIGGEALANKAILPPFWAMWGTNVLMTLVGLVLMLRMGYDTGSGRGGGMREMLDNWHTRRADRARKVGA